MKKHYSQVIEQKHKRSKIHARQKQFSSHFDLTDLLLNRIQDYKKNTIYIQHVTTLMSAHLIHRVKNIETKTNDVSLMISLMRC